MTTLKNSPADPVRRRFRRAAAETVRATIAAGRELYVRDRHLPRLIPIDPADLIVPDAVAERSILPRLARALRAERNRGRAGHWTYDLNRHIALKQAYVAECEILRARGGRPPARPTPANATTGAD